MAFLNDTKSKHLGNFVLVTIGEHRISTRKIAFDGEYYKPILLNIPSISESLDIEQRKYKISSVSLSISDYMEDGVRFSDSLNTLMNKEVVIWFASQSSKTLDDADCYKAGVFIVRSFSQDENKITLNCEDLSQDKLHKDLPLEDLGDGDNVPDKYKNKPIPMVFGEVDRSPCVIKEDLDLENGKYIIKGDDIGVNSNGLFIFRDGNYLLFPFMDDNLSGHYGLSSNRQYSESPTGEGSNVEFIMNNLILNPESTEYKSLVDIDLGLVSLVDKPIKKILLNESFTVDNDLAPDISYSYPANDFGETFNLSSNGTFSFALNDFPATAYQEVHQFNSLIDHVTKVEGIGNIGDVKPYYGVDYNLEITDIDTTDANIETNIFFTMKTSNSSDNMDNVYHPLEGGGVSDAESGAFPFINFEDNWKSISNINQYNQLKISLFAFPRIVGLIAGINSSNATLNINSIIRKIDYIIDKIHTSSFYVEATGRGGNAPTLQEIYPLVLDELDFNNIGTMPEINFGQYAFTIDKKISSKKLLEEISASSGLFPYFKDGQFSVKSIKQEYEYSDVATNSVIYAQDILSYKYDRTKVEKVYSKVNVKYHYDYGLKDFTKETGFIDISNIENELLESLTFDTDQELVFESKYIRNEETALNLAKYLFGLQANQHNLITLKLPLNYLTFSLGQIVRINKLIQDRKCFGEDYTKVAVRNGQQIYPFFFVTSIRKNLDYVEIKLYQLHNLSNVVYVDYQEPIPEVISGCINSVALNYNPEANQSITDGTFGACYFPETLESPEITSHSGNVQIPYEEVDIIVNDGTTYSENTISNLPQDSTFDLNVGTTNMSNWFPATNDELYIPETSTLGIRTDLSNQSVGCYLNLIHANLQLSPSDVGNIYRVSLSIKKITGDAETFYITISHNNNKVDNITITNSWVQHNIDIEINTVNHNRIYIVMNPSTDTGGRFAIDNIEIKEAILGEEVITQELVNPDLSVTWNPSINMIQTIPELGITTAGYYVLIVKNQNEVIYQSEQLQAVENAQGQHIFSLGDNEIPPFTELDCVVVANNPTQYGGEYVYQSEEGISGGGNPIAIDSFTFHWGNVNNQTENIINGDINFDGIINVIDIIMIIGHILGENDLSPEQIALADYSGDGNVNIADVVGLIGDVLDD